MSNETSQNKPIVYPYFKTKGTKMTPNNISLVTTLVEFYKNKNHVNRVIPILRKETNISLRVLDWFVTNYAKRKNISYKLSNGSMFNVYVGYKSQLKAHSKRAFDPFCRKERVLFYYDQDQFIETTIRQLNFFKWALIYGILDYCINHLKEISDDMMLHIESLKKTEETLSGTKETDTKIDIVDQNNKKDLTITAKKTLTKQQTKVILTFD